MQRPSQLVLGVYFGHNASVALARDGEIVFALAEERLRRVKNYTGFPSMAYQRLRAECLAPGETIDLAVFPSDTNLEFSFFIDSGRFSDGKYFDYYNKLGVPEVPAEFSRRDADWIRDYLDADLSRVDAMNRDGDLARRARGFFQIELGIAPDRFRFINHHTAHAYSVGWHVDPSHACLVMTLDGSGDNLCATVNVFEGGTLRELRRTARYPSIGRFYREVTAFLGFKPDEHEHKVMGLAPYARPTELGAVYEKFAPLVSIDPEGDFSSLFPMELTKYFLLQQCAYDRFDAIAGAAQMLIEERTAEWLRYWISRTGLRRVAVAGGVFMNVKLNQRLAELPDLDQLTVVPSAGDESTALGCCYAGVRELGAAGQTITDLTLGPDVRRDELHGVLDRLATGGHVKVERCDDIGARVADLLVSGEVVARVDGRAEWGARALGNRSLLADPRGVGTVHTINRVIKSRDFWMPFAPSILEEDADLYLEPTHRTPAHYMAVTYQATPRGQRDLAAALHPQDFTLRPQLVRRDWNPRYHHLISRFRARTGVGAVLNTSLNLHGEACVLTAADAVDMFCRSQVRYLAIADHLVSKMDTEGMRKEATDAVG